MQYNDPRDFTWYPATPGEIARTPPPVPVLARDSPDPYGILEEIPATPRRLANETPEIEQEDIYVPEDFEPDAWTPRRYPELYRVVRLVERQLGKLRRERSYVNDPMYTAFGQPPPSISFAAFMKLLEDRIVLYAVALDLQRQWSEPGFRATELDGRVGPYYVKFYEDTIARLGEIEYFLYLHRHNRRQVIEQPGEREQYMQNIRDKFETGELHVPLFTV